MESNASFVTKKGKLIKIVEPSMNRTNEILFFANKLVKEDTFLSFNPSKEITFEEEEKWLSAQIEKMKIGSSLLYWATCNDKIIASVDICRGNTCRDTHVGTIGLMIDIDFRGEGIGKFLLDHILKKARENNFKIVILSVFSDNVNALSLYRKMGFKQWGKLLSGLYRRGKFSDLIKMYKNL